MDEQWMNDGCVCEKPGGAIWGLLDAVSPRCFRLLLLLMLLLQRIWIVGLLLLLLLLGWFPPREDGKGALNVVVVSGTLSGLDVCVAAEGLDVCVAADGLERG